MNIKKKDYKFSRMGLSDEDKTYTDMTDLFEPNTKKKITKGKNTFLGKYISNVETMSTAEISHPTPGVVKSKDEVVNTPEPSGEDWLKKFRDNFHVNDDFKIVKFDYVNEDQMAWRYASQKELEQFISTLLAQREKALIEKMIKEIEEYDINNLAGLGSASGSMMKEVVLQYLNSLKGEGKEGIK